MHLKDHLISWNKENFGSLPQKKEEMLQKIKDLDETKSAGPLSKQRSKERAKTKPDFQELVIREEIKWL